MRQSRFKTGFKFFQCDRYLTSYRAWSHSRERLRATSGLQGKSTRLAASSCARDSTLTTPIRLRTKTFATGLEHFDERLDEYLATQEVFGIIIPDFVGLEIGKS